MRRRLTRSRNAMIGGVAAGVAEWLNIDPAIVRIAWAILVPLTSGAALLAYLVAWALLPEEPATSSSGVVDESSPESGAGRSAPAMDEGRTALLLGGALIIIGLWFLGAGGRGPAHAGRSIVVNRPRRRPIPDRCGSCRTEAPPICIEPCGGP